MATHFSKFRGLKNNMQKNTALTKQYMEQMIVREQVDRTKNLHPKVKARWNEMTKEPQPLKFKLHEVQRNSEDKEATYDLFETYKDFHVNEPLVPLEPLPF